MRNADPSARGQIVRRLILGVVAAAYPFIVYVGLTEFSVRPLVVVLAVLAVLRALISPAKERGVLAPVACVYLAILLFSFVTHDSIVVLLTPVYISAAMLTLFGLSLVRPPSAIERIARSMHGDLPLEAVGYCRNVTKVWCLFFVLNGSISLLTVLHGSLAIWTLYNGLISYILIGLLFAVEYFYRRRVMDRTFSELNRGGL